VLDREFGVDVRLTMPGGMVLYAQEKFLSNRYAKYKTLTVEYQQNQHTGEPGDWFSLAPQIYFCAYEDSNREHFDHFVIVDWPALVLATAQGRARWYANRNKDGRARASFKYIPFKEIPNSAIIAHYEDKQAQRLRRGI
jgi:hypothetical protein